MDDVPLIFIIILVRDAFLREGYRLVTGFSIPRDFVVSFNQDIPLFINHAELNSFTFVPK